MTHTPGTRSPPVTPPGSARTHPQTAGTACRSWEGGSRVLQEATDFPPLPDY